MDGAVDVPGLSGRRFLYIVGEDDRRDGALRLGDAECAIDQMARLCRGAADLHEIRRDVLEQRKKIDLLLEVAAEGGARLLTDQGHDGLAVELGIVEAIEQMDRAGARGGEADADLSPVSLAWPLAMNAASSSWRT